jgi:hypothetical protein
VGLARVAYNESNYPLARGHFEEAIQLFSRVGELLGVAETTIWIGRVLRRMGEEAQASKQIKLGFDMYFGIADVEDLGREGWKEINLAFTAVDPRESERHRVLARSTWSAESRLDLVRDWTDLA